MPKTWLITGGASGIGRSTAELVLARGDNLVATARNVGRLVDLARRYGEQVALIELDVTDMSASRVAVDTALERFGRLDVLLNNAGYAHLSPFEQVSEDDFKVEIDTNFYGVVNLTRAALPVMRQQKSGHIINISSSSARFGSPGSTAYTAAKWAVSGFTASLAKEVKPFGVTAVAIEPGSIRTNWTRVARGHVPPLLPEYEPTIGAIMKMTEGYAGTEPGDPDKVATVLFDLSRRDDLPEQLVLGSDALARIAQNDVVRSTAALQWNEVSRSTDFNEDATPLRLLD
ncbi:short-chain dehydrogenase/reductase [Agrobacterium sp. 13-626]|uniref:SDR family NAD(P)-dependent oxidoreductase n=1 Tax=Rhizobium rhizogenes TaxID=359 RepID=UPI0004DB0694|nr:SDR family NAD(P)-dependent oxidoreductase [Rhizobium rhizogenes]KAA6474567.1 SDR family NAD(P)-dependent oxidoreductase [Agrobacterium sp. ICMP 7243]OCJ02831.1 short-chain dehydrogenase/reductase [Agrobacterium sp. 13-626]KEA04278.1 oxidoreductase [Rhizobium rhizogenes]MDJ1638576.1 SDR family NAD(P)-dependent oxidoreductase [Rhizobium rhizogenes]MQB34668.1 SDR family NAD(P)-dependent oxidoreductase [Rhizobium rhizogenes]